MSLFSPSNKHDPDVSLVIDIGTGSIGVAYVRLRGSDTPQVIAHDREVIPFQQNLDVGRFISLMNETLGKVLDRLGERKGDIFPGDCSVTLASPWYVAQTRLVHVAQPEPFVVTEKALKQLVDQEVKLFLDGRSLSTGVGSGDHKLIDARAISIRLNGYTVSRVIGREVKELDMALYCAMMPTALYEGITSVVQKKFGATPVNFHAFMFAVYNSIRDCFNEEASYVIVDVAGEATDVALVRDDVLLETFSFPVGHRAILRTVMRELGIEPTAAASSIDLYLSGTSTEEHSKAMEPIVEKAMRDWQRLFRGSLAQIAEQYPIPREMYLLCDENYRDYYEKELFDAGDEVLSETGERFRIHTLEKGLLEHFVEFPEDVEWDGFLCVIIMMIAKLRALKNTLIYEQ